MHWVLATVACSFSTCSSAMRATPSPHLTRLFWLHVPKCGTSFGFVIYSYACPRLPAAASIAPPPVQDAGHSDLGKQSIMLNLLAKYKPSTYCPKDAFEPGSVLFHHDPLRASLSSSHRGVALFRDPVNRLYSAFHSLHAQGMRSIEKVKLRNASTSPRTYAQFPGIASCQVKMLNGYQCAGPKVVGVEELEVAKRRLTEAFAFIGLTEHYNLSVHLFHAMFGGSPRASVFENARPTAHFIHGFSQAEASRYLTPEDDPFDTELYIEACRIFANRLEAYGFEVPPNLWRHLEVRGFLDCQRRTSASIFMVIGAAILLCLCRWKCYKKFKSRF